MSFFWYPTLREQDVFRGGDVPFLLLLLRQVKKSKFREPGGSRKKKNDAVAAGTGEVEAATLVERPREYVVTLHFPEVLFY